MHRAGTQTERTLLIGENYYEGIHKIPYLNSPSQHLFFKQLSGPQEMLCLDPSIFPEENITSVTSIIQLQQMANTRGSNGVEFDRSRTQIIRETNACDVFVVTTLSKIIILERTMKKKISRALFLMTAFFCATSIALAAGMAPDALVKQTSEDVLKIVKKDKDIQAGNKRKIYALVDAKVLPHFDFNPMTQLAVGKSWRQATPAQQNALVKEFRTLLVRTYSVALSTYRNKPIDYKPLKMQPGDTDVTVKTVVKQSGGPVSIDYSLRKNADGWKVYDVVVDGASLVTVYRSSFDSEIQQSGIDGLIKSLVNKNRTAGSSGAKG